MGNTNYISGTLNAANLAVGGPVKANTIKLEQFEPPEKCKKRKGGPRSKTFCEVYEKIPHTTHMGRSYCGRWYSWKDEE